MAAAGDTLRNSGQTIMSSRGVRGVEAGLISARGDRRYDASDMSIEQMEMVLARGGRTKPADQVRPSQAPQTARALLEENKQMIEEKRERKAIERKASRELVETLLARDQLNDESEKARDMSRRHAQQDLAKYYKAKIAETSRSKVETHRSKIGGPEIQYFPFVEGETIQKSREAQSARMRDEMRAHLRQQRATNPPRADSLMADTDREHCVKYPMMPVHSQSAMDAVSQRVADAAPSLLPEEPNANVAPSAEASLFLAGDQVAPHMARYPRFLSRSREHMSRRLHDHHVRKALEDKVRQTRAELEEQAKKRAADVQQWQDGMLVNDALRYDASKMKVGERKRNQEFIQQQIDEKRSNLQTEVDERRAQACGYWGPDEKELQDDDLLRNHCSDLVAQIEVNANRRTESRNRQIRLEKRLIDNSIAEMSQERDRDKQKLQHHRAVLTTTWNSQKQIRKAMQKIDNM